MDLNKLRLTLTVASGLVVLVSLPASAQDAEEFAKKLANPVASLISVPFQLNWDGDIGPDDGGERFQLNAQPVIPISLNRDRNLISPDHRAAGAPERHLPAAVPEVN